ncbi:pullulanase-type alpha-1,6-glucosidase [Marinobacter sp. C2H3]|uniref:pullulanase-type alpha-1,6-glucosidase n=1 Tax=Marinobacter sp. C2H3 TaxID=3119003 RepID=UPI00300F753B
MPERHRVPGGWALALPLALTISLTLAGCNSGGGTATTDTRASPPDTPQAESLLEPGPDEALLYYKRPDGQYDGWGLHLWNDTAGGCDGLADNVPTDWGAPRQPDGISATYGAYYRIPMREAGDCLNFIVHQGDTKDIGGTDHRWSFDALGQRLFTLSGSADLSTTPLQAEAVTITGASAHWLDATTLVFKDTGNLSRVELRYDPGANIRIDVTGQVSGGQTLALSRTTLPTELASRFPHLAGWDAYTVEADTATIKQALKGQLVALAFNGAGELVTATQVQIPGVLDDLYAYSGDLGATVDGADVRFAVWAPTAQRVRLHAFDQATHAPLPGFPVTMTQDQGVWRYTGSRAELDRQYYQYEVTAYHPETGRVETAMASDPYALSLSTNGQYVQVVNLDDNDLKPSGWDTLTPPSVAASEDVVVYETHIRDFSAGDTTVPAEQRGKYEAFTLPADGSVNSVAHLKALADAGVTHLHLLPAFDIATINEDPAQRVDLDDPFSRLCALSDAAAEAYADQCSSSDTIRSVLTSYDPLSGDAQALYSTFRSLDSFNWGYDPVHYTVPEGSYASDADGAARILEFRDMVKGLTGLGLNVVMDVVYNHTNASGLADRSVLDKIVPGYYHRLNPETGAVEQSTCCENTASEHAMMEKLMIDSLVTWARAYKISGFRFDLMGHHMLGNMEKALAAVQAIDPDTYFYGEGWNFGEVADNARGVNAVQANLAGTGIGSFNDRLRDAVRGGSPFDSEDTIRRTQGFASGLYTAPNDLNSGSADELNTLLTQADWIRVGIAGGLKDYTFTTADGTVTRASDIDYNGQAAGYTADPQELINYVSKHDNQTLWDNNQYKAPYTDTVMVRAQRQVVALAIPLLSQGVPFLQMGSELLRSKSMERDSYDSGDWFNAVDFSAQGSAWNRGLPRQDKDGANWPLIESVITSSAGSADPTPAAIAYTVDQVSALLALRHESPLFRLQTAQAVEDRLTFLNTGPGQIPGVIAFHLQDGDGVSLADLDGARSDLVVVINGSPAPQTLSHGLAGTPTVALDTSPGSSAGATGTEVTVPGLSVAVFSL